MHYFPTSYYIPIEVSHYEPGIRNNNVACSIFKIRIDKNISFKAENWKIFRIYVIIQPSVM